MGLMWGRTQQEIGVGFSNKADQYSYQAGYLAGRRIAWLEANGPCRQCGSWERLEVDHVDPSQKVTHRVWSLSRDERQRELAKCQVLCHDCHKAKSDAAMRKPLVHGTTNAYKKKKCRCEHCRRVNSRIVMDQKRRKMEGANP